MHDLTNEILELIRLTSTDLSPDVEKSLHTAVEKETPGSAARGALETVIENVEISRRNSSPICQDTGTPIFFVRHPAGWSTRKLKEQIRTALAEATKKSYMRPNAVNAVTEKNSGNNLGGDDFPSIHFEEVDGEELTIELILKGGGCENVGAQYSLPDDRLGAGRDLAGVRKAVLDAVHKAQGQGCAPGILGISIGATAARATPNPRRSCSRRLASATRTQSWLHSRSSSRKKPTNSASVQWVSAEKRPSWIPRSPVSRACRLRSSSPSPTCAGHTADAR